jgi:hypothetical protein
MRLRAASRCDACKDAAWRVVSRCCVFGCLDFAALAILPLGIFHTLRFGL